MLAGAILEETLAGLRVRHTRWSGLSCQVAEMGKNQPSSGKARIKI
jgi:hypothetical protein